MCENPLNMSMINMRLAKLQTYGILSATDRVQSQYVWITDLPLYSPLQMTNFLCHFCMKLHLTFLYYGEDHLGSAQKGFIYEVTQQPRRALSLKFWLSLCIVHAMFSFLFLV